MRARRTLLTSSAVSDACDPRRERAREPKATKHSSGPASTVLSSGADSPPSGVLAMHDGDDEMKRYILLRDEPITQDSTPPLSPEQLQDVGAKVIKHMRGGGLVVDMAPSSVGKVKSLFDNIIVQQELRYTASAH